MCSSIFKAPSMPAPPPPPEPLPAPPTPAALKEADEQVIQARRDTRKRAASLASLSGTRLTSPLGLTTQATTMQKSLLGQ